MKKLIPPIVLVLLLVVAVLIQKPVVEDRLVTRIIDGDTIVVEGGERVRLLDIDTPERGEPCYQEAKDRLEELIDGKEVTLEPHAEDRDRYGRLLRYVFLEDQLINLVLVHEGLATLYVYNKGPYHNYFVKAEQTAKEYGCVFNQE